MHELALTEGIISIVESEKKKHGFERVSEISLKLGEYSGVIPECMEEFFPIAKARKFVEFCIYVDNIGIGQTVAVYLQQCRFSAATYASYHFSIAIADIRFDLSEIPVT